MAVSLRQWVATDLDSLVTNANNIHVWNNLRNYFPHPYTVEAGNEWLEKTIDATPIVNLAIDVDGVAIGGIGLILNSDVYVMSAEIGYWLGEAYWGKGIGTEAVRLMVEYAFYYFDIVTVICRSI